MPRRSQVDIWALSDLCTPWCVHVVATFRIADHIATGITQIDDLAAASGSGSDSLHRVLRHIVGKGVFEEPAPGRFALNPPAHGLLDSATRLGLDLGGIDGRMTYAWGSLLGAVRTGAPAYHEVFHRPFWEDLQAHPDLAASFDALMGPAGHGIPDPEVLVAGGWESVRTVVDVGGGTGSLLAEILRARPEVGGTLVDLPPTVARSVEIFQVAGVAERVTAEGQSFFDRRAAWSLSAARHRRNYTSNNSGTLGALSEQSPEATRPAKRLTRRLEVENAARPGEVR